MAEQNGQRTYEFADFRLIPREGLLLRGGVPISLTPKTFAILVLLVERHGHLIQKSELLDRVWESSFVEEGAVSKSIWTIRNALGDDSKGKKFIQTIPKRGYRFVAEVRVVDMAPELPEGQIVDLPETGSKRKVIRFPKADTSKIRNTAVVTEPAPPETNGEKVEIAYGNGLSTPAAIDGTGGQKATQPGSELSLPHNSPSNRIRPVTVLGALVLAALGLVAAYFVFGERSILGEGGSNRIAILPPKPVNIETRDPIYELGIADSLILKIGPSQKLDVRQLNAVRSYVELERDPIEIGKEQDVDYVLASHYQIVGGRIRVTSQLFDVATGRVEDTFTVEKDSANLFTAQDAIADEIGDRLLARFGGAPTGFEAKRGTKIEEAYRSYLQGMYLVDRSSPSDALRALEFLDQAVRLDRNYAKAWAGKAHAHRVVGNQGPASGNHDEYRRSNDAINIALRLDPNLADAYSVLCDNKIHYEYDFDGAEEACRRSIDLDPNSSRTHRTYGLFLQSAGRFDESIAELKKAIDLEPTSLTANRNLGMTLYYARRYPEAVIELKRIFAMDPTFLTTSQWLVVSLEQQENYAEAFEWFMKWQSLAKADEAEIRAFEVAYRTSGWQGVLREEAKRCNSGKPAAYCATIYAQIGDKDKAFEYLEKAYEQRHWAISKLRVDPRLDPLRDDPRFAEFLKRVAGN